VTNRPIHQWISAATTALTIGAAVAIFSGYLTSRQAPPNELIAQVDKVSQALTDVSKITNNLEELKKQITEAAAEKDRVEREYSRVAALRTLTQEQLQAVRASLTHRTVWEIIWENLLAFAIGVVSSFVASALWFFGYTRRTGGRA
jgi:sensor c-di-GMP phosphodiesterase-like protein